MDLRHAVGAGFRISDFLQLVTVDIQFRVEDGIGRQDVVDADPDVIAAGVLGDHAQAGGDQVDGRETLVDHVIGRLGGIVPVFPLPFLPIVEIVIIVGVRLVPGGLIRFRDVLGGNVHELVRRGAALEFGLFPVDGIVLLEGDPDPVDRARLLLEEAGKVDAEVLPFVQVPRRVGVQAQAALVDEPARATDRVGSVQLVVLQEHQYVFFIDLDDPDVHGFQVDGLEREDQFLGVGKDRSLHRNLDGGLLLGGGELPRDAGPQGRAVPGFQAVGNGELHRLLAVGFIVDLRAGVFNLYIVAAGAVQGDHAGEIVHVREGLAEMDVDVRVGCVDPLGAHHAEGALGGDRNLALATGGESRVERFQAQGKGALLVAPVEPEDFEVVVERVAARRHVHFRAVGGILVLQHLLDGFQRQFLRQGDGAFHAGEFGRGGRDRDTVYVQDGFLDGDEEGEVELLEALAAHFVDLVQAEMPRVGLSAFQRPGFRQELQRPRAGPAGRSLDGRREGQETVPGVLAGRDVRRVGREFDADGRLVRDDAAGVRFDERGELGALAAGRTVAAAGSEGKGDE